MVSVVEKNIPQNEDEDEDLEALRMAALMSLPKKELPPPKPTPASNVIFQPHRGNPNLIAIIPEGASPAPVTVHPHYIRHAPRQQHFRPANTISTIGSTLKVLPQVQIEKKDPKPLEENVITENKEEVSTKFTRFEDTESESEDDSDHNKKESNSSEEDNDVLDLVDDDDSLEALMAKMEHEIGLRADSTKKEKKKTKSGKSKAKDSKCKEAERQNGETKTAVVEPTIKESDETRATKCDKNKANKKPISKPEDLNSPMESQATSPITLLDHNKILSPPRNKSPVRRSKSPVKEKVQSPNRNFSPIRDKISLERIVTRSKSPIKQRILSPRRSPTKQRVLSPRKSPIKQRTLSPRKSPINQRIVSPRRILIKQRTRSPTKQRTLSPRRSPINQRKRSPRRSPIKQRSVSPRRSPIRYRSVSPKRSPLKQRILSPRRSPVKHRTLSPKRSPLTQRIMSPRRSPIKHRTSPKRSPLTQRIVSPRRSPIRSNSSVTRPLSPARRKSPRKLTPDRRSPLRISSDRFYSEKKSPSPFYRSRARDYLPRNRSPSPTKRRSISPKKNYRNSSPKYYRKRSLSPWSPVFKSSAQNRSPSPKYRSRSPLRRRSVSPRNRRPAKLFDNQSPSYWSPRRRAPSASPKRLRSPLRKRDYSPRRQQTSPRREVNYRKSSSPKRKLTPQYKNYSPPLSPRHKQKSPSPRKDSPKRRTSPVTIKEINSEMNPSNHRKSKSPSLSLSPSPREPREIKEPSRRYKSPLRPRKDSADNRSVKPRRDHSFDNGRNSKDKRKPATKVWGRGREGRKLEERRRERSDKTNKDSRREKDSKTIDKQRHTESKEEVPRLKVSDNPVFEARRKKFENTCLIEPASKKIRLANKKTSPSLEKVVKEEKIPEPIENKIIEGNNNKVEDEKSVHNEIDEIDNFLNEDVLDLSAAFWSSDDDLLPTLNTKQKTVTKKENSFDKQSSVKERITLNKKVNTHMKVAAVSPQIADKRTVGGKSKLKSSPIAMQRSPQLEAGDDQKNHEDGDLRAELSRRREERLTKAGSLHEKLPARLLQSAFASALGKKKSKKDGKLQKGEKLSKKSKATTPPAHKEKTDGRRVLVLKRPPAVRMQSAHINVTFPKDGGSDSESSYSSSTSSDERYSAPKVPKQRLPVYMRLGTAQNKHSKSRKVKLRSRRRQV